MKISRFPNEIRRFIIERKKANTNLSCRNLANLVFKKYKIKISKSSVNALIQQARLSSPKGRRTSVVFAPRAESACAGYVFLLGADLLLGLSNLLASVIQAENPQARLRLKHIAVFTRAWILAKAIYGVTIDKITSYDKSDLWLLLGRRLGKGEMEQFLDNVILSQHITQQAVALLSSRLQDVLCVKVHLADGSSFCLDGEHRCLWRSEVIPIDFSTTIYTANSYINSLIEASEPAVVFCARPDTGLGDEMANFIFGLDGSSSGKRIRKIDFLSPQGEIVKSASFVLPRRRRFVIGVWPWQYKPIGDLEKHKARGRVFLEAFNREYVFLEDSVKFSQHAHNIEVTLRNILIKSAPDGPARLALLTNLDPEETAAAEVVHMFARRFADLEAEHAFIATALKTPSYYDNFLSSEKLLRSIKRLNDCGDWDNFFSLLVEILNMFSQRVFLGTECSGWGLLKTRELIYKKSGFVKRDLAEDVLFNLFIDNKLEENKIFSNAVARFNDAAITEDSGRKISIAISSPPKNP